MRPNFHASHWTIAGDTHPVRDRGVSRLPIDVRVEAAAKAGYRGISLLAADLRHIRQTPQWADYRNIYRLLELNGIHAVELDLVTDWFMDGPRGEASAAITHELLEAAEALKASHIKVIGDTQRQFPFEKMIQPFADLCSKAADVGTKIGIEVTPSSNLIQPADALKLIETSGASNAGVILDIWHIARAGIPYERIEEIPGSLILGVELCDAAKEPEGTLAEDCINHRKLCGEGGLDTKSFANAVVRTGYSGLFAVEILSEEHRARPLDEAASVAIQSASDLFRQVVKKG